MIIFIVIAFTPLIVAIPLLWYLNRSRLYRATDLKRAELNRMHRHTLITVAMCMAFIAVGLVIPAVSAPFIWTALVMLVIVLPLRTVMIELGVRRHPRNHASNSTVDRG